MLNFLYEALQSVADRHRSRRSGRQILARLGAGLSSALLLAIVWTLQHGWPRAEAIAAAPNLAAGLQADPDMLWLLPFGAVTLGLTLYYLLEPQRWLTRQLARLLAGLCSCCNAKPSSPPNGR